MEDFSSEVFQIAQDVYFLNIDSVKQHLAKTSLSTLEKQYLLDAAQARIINFSGPVLPLNILLLKKHHAISFAALIGFLIIWTFTALFIALKDSQVLAALIILCMAMGMFYATTALVWKTTMQKKASLWYQQALAIKKLIEQAPVKA